MSSTISRIVDNGGQGFLDGTTILDTDMDQELDQLVGAHNSLVADKLERDGTQQMLANLPMGGFKVTGAADGTDAQDLVTKSQLDAAVAGNNEFTELTDTPSSYATYGNRLVKVNGSANGLEFGDLEETQIMIKDGTRAFTGVVEGVDPTAAAHLATKNYVDGKWVTSGSDLYSGVSGNVGIGDTTPNYKLAVQDSFASTTGVETVASICRKSDGVATDNIGGAIVFQAENSAGVCNNAAGILWKLIDVTDGTEDGILQFLTRTAGSESVKMTVLNDGSVGIGTETPGSLLEVAGQIHSTSTGFKFPDNSTLASAAFLALGDTPSSFSGAGGDYVKVNSGGTALEFVSSISHASLDNLSADDHTDYLRVGVNRTSATAITTAVTVTSGNNTFEVQADAGAAKLLLDSNSGSISSAVLESGTASVTLAFSDGTNKLSIDKALNMNSQLITAIATPSSGTDAANKDYVDKNNGPKDAGVQSATATGTSVDCDFAGITDMDDTSVTAKINGSGFAGDDVSFVFNAVRFPGETAWHVSGTLTDDDDSNIAGEVNDRNDSTVTWTSNSITYTITISHPTGTDNARVNLTHNGSSRDIGIAATAEAYEVS